MQLTSLPLGSIGEVVKLNAAGKKRRRFLDLGLIPGTTVTCSKKSPSGDPKAFVIRGTTIALRSEETDLVEVKLQKGGES